MRALLSVRRKLTYATTKRYGPNAGLQHVQTHYEVTSILEVG